MNRLFLCLVIMGLLLVSLSFAAVDFELNTDKLVYNLFNNENEVKVSVFVQPLDQVNPSLIRGPVIRIISDDTSDDILDFSKVYDKQTNFVYPTGSLGDGLIPPVIGHGWQFTFPAVFKEILASQEMLNFKVNALSPGIVNLMLAGYYTTDGDITLNVPSLSQEVVVINCGDSICQSPEDIVNCQADCDQDGDGVISTTDNCIYLSNPDQADLNGDGIGDACECIDLDQDSYGVGYIAGCVGMTEDCDDNDPFVYPGHAETCDGKDNNCNSETDENAIDCPEGQSCVFGKCALPDSDGDGFSDDSDNCPGVTNPDQADIDLDEKGDACDFCTDADEDGYGVCPKCGQQPPAACAWGGDDCNDNNAEITICSNGQTCSDGICIEGVDTDSDEIFDHLENSDCVIDFANSPLFGLTQGVSYYFPGGGYYTELIGCMKGDFNHNSLYCTDDHFNYIAYYGTNYDKNNNNNPIIDGKQEYDLNDDGFYNVEDHFLYISIYGNVYNNYKTICSG